MAKKYVCAECGHDAVQWDATSEWNEEKQAFELVGTMDQTYCPHCNGECKVKEVELPDKPDTNKLPIEIETACIATVISNTCFNRVYENRDENREGYIDIVHLIADWAVEFYNVSKDWDWDDVVNNPRKYGYPDCCCCWDDVVMEWTEQRLGEYAEQKMIQE